MTDIQTDVIVVGGGGAGMAAAIEAAMLGRRTVLLEKNSELGGSTAWSPPPGRLWVSSPDAAISASALAGSSRCCSAISGS